MGFLENYKNLIYDQSNSMSDFMHLLMKQRNAKGKWTTEDVTRIRSQLELLSNSVPFLIVFILPLGFLMLPLLARALDRRKAARSTLKAEEAFS